MNPTDLIGRCRPFEPPFRRRGKNIKDRNLHTLLQVKAYGTLREALGIDIEEGARTIADHICNLLNREHAEEGDEKMKAWIAKNEDGQIYIYFKTKPYKNSSFWINNYNITKISTDLFPSVKWEDEEPTEVEITIKPKEK